MKAKKWKRTWFLCVTQTGDALMIYRSKKQAAWFCSLKGVQCVVVAVREVE